MTEQLVIREFLSPVFKVCGEASRVACLFEPMLDFLSQTANLVPEERDFCFLAQQIASLLVKWLIVGCIR